MSKSVQDITEELIKLQHDYAFTRRTSNTEERYIGLVKSGLITNPKLDLDIINEALIEHVGHLPIIASYLHPLIEHKDGVDLGRALIMLSVHDIGETKVGDVLTFTKSAPDADSESKIAKQMLPDYLYKYFEEIENRETLDAKFAKAVDSVAPILHEMSLPKVTIAKFKYYSFGIEKIIAKKKVHFEWDKVLDEMFEYLIAKYRLMENDSL